MTVHSNPQDNHTHPASLDYSEFDEKIRRMVRTMFVRRLREDKRKEDPEDFVQLTCIKFWLSIDKYDRSKPLAPYVFEIACNIYWDFIKSPQNIVHDSLDTFGEYPSVIDYGEEEAESTLADSFVQVEEDRESSPSREKVEERLSILACETDRKIIRMHYGLDREYPMIDERIAEELCVSRQTVNKKRKSAETLLKDRFGERTSEAAAA